MPSRQAIICLLAAAISVAPVAASAQSETVLHNYWRHSGPYAAPFEDRYGTLFLPTYSGHRWGDVTKLFMKDGAWRKRTIFTFNGSDGENPSGALIQDDKGVLYGLTNFGGTNGFYGTIYSLTRAGRVWNQAVLYSFSGGADGGQPRGSLVRDKSTGVIYGTADGGGTASCGTVFALTPSGNSWSYEVIHTFTGGSGDGCYPGAGIGHISADGALFGATAAGGSADDGTVYELKQSRGVWTQSILYSFKGGNDGIYPGELVGDAKSNLFGVAGTGINGPGLVYEVSRTGHGWQKSDVYAFTGGSDGGGPTGLAIDKSTGNILGAADFGGSQDDGAIFKLAFDGSSWTESVLYSFGANADDGLYPSSRPVEDPVTGAIYGTTSEGGDQKDGGTLYQFTPN